MLLGKMKIVTAHQEGEGGGKGGTMLPNDT
jgi:hypothetical protein